MNQLEAFLTAPTEFDDLLHSDELRTASDGDGPIHRAADAHRAKFAVAVRYAFAMGRRAVGIGRPDADKIAGAVGKALEEVITPTLVKVVTAGGEAGVVLLQKQLRAAEARGLAGPVLKLRFDAQNPAVIEWARQHAAELVTQISETTRDRIRLAVEELQADGDWEFAHDRIAAAVGDQDRADLIARHETMLAAGEGQRQAWDQATEEGLLTGDEKRVWIATPDEKLCPICAELEDETAPLDGKYVGGIEGPPAHIQCRCTEGII